MVLSLLRRYLQVYWLKPFDAINDTANAWALRQCPWEEPILEIGGGDGVFSFIMHGGEFIAADDRYDQADPERSGDIFDVYRHGAPLTVKRPAGRSYAMGVDLKVSHVSKCKETGLYRFLVIGEPGPLPVAGETFKTVFLYFPHGLVERGARLDYQRILREIRRVVQPGGELLMTAMNRNVSGYFVCYPLHRFFEHKNWGRLSDYFKRLDGGRYAEISGFGRSLDEWRALLSEAGFRLVEAWTHGSPTAWRVCDLQTRPILRPLIRGSRFLKRVGLKGIVKALWVGAWFPVLALFYLALARPVRILPEAGHDGRLLFVFRAVPA